MGDSSSQPKQQPGSPNTNAAASPNTNETANPNTNATASPVVALLSTSMKRSWPSDQANTSGGTSSSLSHAQVQQIYGQQSSSSLHMKHNMAGRSASSSGAPRPSSELMRKASDLAQPGGWIPPNLKGLIQELLLREDSTVCAALESNNLSLLLEYVSSLPHDVVLSLTSKSNTQSQQQSLLTNQLQQQSLATNQQQPLVTNQLQQQPGNIQSRGAELASVAYPVMLQQWQQHQQQQTRQMQQIDHQHLHYRDTLAQRTDRQQFAPVGPQPSATRPRLTPSPVLQQETSLFPHGVAGQPSQIRQTPAAFSGVRNYQQFPGPHHGQQQVPVQPLTLAELLQNAQQQQAAQQVVGQAGIPQQHAKRNRPLSMANLVSFREQNRPKTAPAGIPGMQTSTVQHDQQRALSAIMSLGNQQLYPTFPVPMNRSSIETFTPPNTTHTEIAPSPTFRPSSTTTSRTQTDHSITTSSSNTQSSAANFTNQGNVGRAEQPQILATTREYSKKKKEPSAAPRRWTEQEDNLLRSAVKRYKGKDWKLVAEQVPGRSHVQCLQRWRKALDPGVVKGHWTVDEDTRLLVLVSENPKNWGHVAKGIPGRTAKQCRERYHNHLDPSIRKGDWTEQEDAIIVKKQAQVGNRWAEISKFLPGRTENSVKIRWKSIQRQGKNADRGARSSQSKSSTSQQLPKQQLSNVALASNIDGTTSWSAQSASPTVSIASSSPTSLPQTISPQLEFASATGHPGSVWVPPEYTSRATLGIGQSISNVVAGGGTGTSPVQGSQLHELQQQQSSQQILSPQQQYQMHLLAQMRSRHK